MRIAIRALAINSRSMVAIKRPNSVAEGAKLNEAVLDILVTFCGTVDSLHLRLNRNLGIPDATANPFVCIAAFLISQCNITRRKLGKSKQ